MKLFSIATLAAVLAGVSADAAGVSASLSQPGMNYVLETAIPIVEAALQKIAIPDMSTEKDGFDISVTNVVCTGFKVGNGAISTAPGTGVTVSLDTISLACSGDWSFKLHIWPHIPDGSGSADVSISSTNAVVGLDVKETNGIPQVAATAVSLNIGSMDISFHGSLWDWLLDLLKDMFGGAIKDAVSKAFDSAVTNFVNVNANTMLAKLKYDIPLHFRYPYNISEVLFHLTSDPVFNTSYIGVALQGDVENINNPVPAPFAPPALPPFDASAGDSYIQMHLSDYTALSAVWVYYSAGLTQWYLASDKIPLGLNKTEAYILIAPGFPAAYPSAPVSINITFADMPIITIAPTGIIGYAPIAFDFEVTTSNGDLASGFTILTNTSFSIDLAVGPDANGTIAITAHLNYLDSALTVSNTNVGPVTVSLLQDLIDFVFSDILVPVINDIFGNGIPLPSLDGIELVDTQLTLGNQDIMIATNFAINTTSVFGTLAAPVTMPTVQQPTNIVFQRLRGH